MPWIKVLLSQGLALGCLYLLPSGILPGAPLILVLQGVAAAAIGRIVGLSLLWIPIQFLLPLAIAYNSSVPSWVYPAALVFCLLIYWNSASEQVPLYLTNRRTWKALGDLVTAENAKTFVDLGSGMGGVVTALAGAHPGLRAIGLETAPLVFLASRIRLLFAARANAQVIYKSIWDEDLAAHDIVYCFLSPVPMPRMFAKAKAEMRPGTLFVSNSFAVPGQEPTGIKDVADGRKTRLYLYRM
ncbi:hypothetical protein [Pararhizobium antarcticum]|uniref:Trans-aconitate methyltransferase n=1 Tax=Pararhizobium antarcticum TaxID=1798805 RepID=A0A657LRP3_9HYPH|nr:hypothetical protein [Pararhizobium antarcticum]OJF95090.1 hypothetical protein AX760_04505 [Pararhizobium antarcticum]OJF98088.1 hypothetical protein AX761_12785 [Rhizobium sp. 58]